MYYDHKFNMYEGPLRQIKPPIYPMGDEELPAFDIEKAFKAHGAELSRLNVLMEKDLFWRRVGTIATVAGTLFAAVKLADILIAIRRRSRTEST
jgi:hypothetical protein